MKITPVFNGSYNGDLMYTMPDFTALSLDSSIESISLEYKSILDIQSTGFEDTVYLLDEPAAEKTLAFISVTLVGDLKTSVIQQLTQLAKGTIGGAMSLIFEDDFATERNYYCKWVNVIDFVENNEVFGGGSIELNVYKITALS